MDLERELALHHAATLRAIETGRVELAERRLKAYVRFAEAFVEAAAKHGVRFSPDTAPSVSFFDWPTAMQIIRHAWDGIAAAVKSDSEELLLVATYLPIEFLRMSVRQKDFLFFYSMLRFYPYILSLSYTTSVVETKGLIIDRSWRHLREFADFFLVELTAHYDEETRQQFVSQLLWTFSDLLKVALDHSDVETFGTLGRETNGLFDALHLDGMSRREAAELTRCINSERRLIWFGLGAWLLRSHVLRNSPRTPDHPDPRLVDPSKIGALFQQVSANFSNLRALAATYLEAHTRPPGRSNWNGWLMETLPERQVHSLNFGTWLAYFYIVQGLRLGRTGTPAASDIPTPHRELQFRMQEIETTLDHIQQQPEGWATLLPVPAATSAVEGAGLETGEGLRDRAIYFLAVNNIAVTEWKHRREDAIISAPLDDSQLALFREECYKAWSEGAWVARLFAERGCTEERAAPPDSTYMACHFTMPKEAFISERDIEYGGFGGNVGSALARDVSESVLKQLRSVIAASEPVSLDKVVDKTLTQIAEMRDAGLQTLVIVSGDFDLEDAFGNDQRFMAKWREQGRQSDIHTYFGKLDGTLVFFQADDPEQDVIVLDLAEIGSLVRYVPPNDSYHELLVRVRTVDEEHASNIIEKQPERLNAKDGTNKSREEAVRELLLQVEVVVGVRLEFEVKDPQSGRLIPIT